MSRRKKNFDDYVDAHIADPKLRKNPVYVTGKISVNLRGFAFVTSDDGGKDIFIPPNDIGSAMHGDSVKVRITADYGEKREGEVVEVTERGKNIFICRLKNRGKLFWAEPEDAKFNLEIHVRCDDKKYWHEVKRRKAKVVVKITDWKKLNGEILEVIDAEKDVGSDITAILRSYGVFENFPAEVLAEASRLETTPNADEIARRIDRRNLKIVTIDGEDAKDLDDGVFAKKIDGGYFLGVYIADVSYYVRPNTALDREAFERGTSIYPVDRVVPMLPVELSNGICSLNAGVDRFAMACEMTLDAAGRVIDHKIFPTVIHVFRRLSYTQVQKFIDGEKSELANCAENINTLFEIYKLRKKIRRERGSIDFDLPEIKIELNEEERPVKLWKKINGVAENIIEECMLAANETVAEHMINKKIPGTASTKSPPLIKLKFLTGCWHISVCTLPLMKKIFSRDIFKKLSNRLKTILPKKSFRLSPCVQCNRHGTPLKILDTSALPRSFTRILLRRFADIPI